MSRAKVIRAQAPQYRQYVLISDFLDLACLSTQEEAALATTWIKDRPEGLKLQNLMLATRTIRSTGSLLENLTADVHYAIKKCESLGSGKQLVLHGNQSAIAMDFHRICHSFDLIFCRLCPCRAVCYFRAPSVAILTSLRPAVNPLGAPLENPFKTNWREGLSCSPIRLFQHRT